MTNKMAARDLSYELGSLSYGAWKVENSNKDDGLLFFKLDLWRTGFLGFGIEWYHYQQELTLSKTIV